MIMKNTQTFLQTSILQLTPKPLFATSNDCATCSNTGETTETVAGYDGEPVERFAYCECSHGIDLMENEVFDDADDWSQDR